MTFEEALQKFREDKPSLNEKQIAEREEALWRQLLLESPPSPSGVDRTRALTVEFAKALGEVQFAIRNRRTILMLGDLAEPLWARILDKKMLVSTAVRIIRDAKVIGMENRLSMREAITAALEEYDSLPFFVLVDGVPVRRNTTSRTDVDVEEKVSRVVPSGTAKSDDYLMWQKIQADLTSYIEKKVGGAHGLTGSTIVKEFIVGVKVLIHETQNKIKRAAELQRESAKARRIPRHAVVAACNTLKMDHPGVGQPVNLDLAKRQKKILARLYHPDAHGGSDRTRLLYEEALAAYDLLEEYNEQLEPNGETTHNA